MKTSKRKEEHIYGSSACFAQEKLGKPMLQDVLHTFPSIVIPRHPTPLAAQGLNCRASTCVLGAQEHIVQDCSRHSPGTQLYPVSAT